ncbi:TPA: hypothetical protein JBD00_08595 [Legionella pneumophila subsp. pneumophila]|mgnify:CR=1 FL=1|nr:hypothetical protein [Legionella pneumophila subsp. pneumophila]HAU0817319.1 hypothetical protein [Legionella pneumophila]HAT9491275.1 hypothetical protein [Legionella pneumophila subsp. pneumophila]HAU1515511.1 hypothetical protein [Legionella pneumophila]HAU1996273.1 hypothetical protein [Legionella pneumophila]
MLLRKGNYANADILRCGKFIIKTFSNKNYFIKYSIGRFLIYREYKAIMALNQIESFKRQCVKKKFSLKIEYIEGVTLSEYLNNRHLIEEESLLTLEKDIKSMHALGYVHLDIRNARNLIVTPRKKICIIDFQSAIKLNKFIPVKLQKLLQNTDLSAVMKFWNKGCNSVYPREDELKKYIYFLKLWPFKGYPLKKAKTKLKTVFRALLRGNSSLK